MIRSGANTFSGITTGFRIILNFMQTSLAVVGWSTGATSVVVEQFDKQIIWQKDLWRYLEEQKLEIKNKAKCCVQLLLQYWIFPNNTRLQG